MLAKKKLTPLARAVAASVDIAHAEHMENPRFKVTMPRRD